SGFLFVGRVGRDKGADIALRATRDAGQKITIIGRGELESEADRFPDATFTGWLDREEIAGHARRARALIVPSRVTEPFGLVILEAAMSGLPVIVSDSAYLSRDAERMGFGSRVSVSDEAALCETINRFATDDSLIRAMSECAFYRSSALCHTPESWTDAHLEIFSRKLGQVPIAESGHGAGLRRVAT
ncbi:glycosyltransferase family 4 protein, partial [Henriciella pelagia]